MRTAGSGPICRVCDYHLAGLRAGNCPECATDFDPADPTTLARTADLGQRSVRSAAPALAIAHALLALHVLWRSTPALGFDLFAALGPIVLWLGFTAIWTATVVLYFWQRADTRGRLRTPARLLALVPALWFVTFALTCAGVPSMLRWRLEEAGMVRLAKAALATPNPNALNAPLPPRLAFGYRCDGITVAPYGVRFELAELPPRGWLFDHSFAIVYAPAGPPPMRYPMTLEHIRGEWYLVFEND